MRVLSYSEEVTRVKPQRDEKDLDEKRMPCRVIVYAKALWQMEIWPVWKIEDVAFGGTE